MPGSRAQEWEHREVTFRIGSSEHIEIISEIVPVSVGIPADVTVWLMIITVAFTVADPFFKTVTGSGFPLLRSSVNRGSVS
jgi:hypothetical protein